MILFDFATVDWLAYNPGLLEQDVLTIPLEAGLIGAINAFYTPSPRPLYPFRAEVRPNQRNKSRHPKELLAPIGAAWAVGTLSYFETTSDRFPIAPYVRGWIHAHLVNEIFTTFAKTTFQRPRPFYDSELAKGTTREDDRFSFFSGHASHAFTFAGYSSAMVLAESDYAAGGYVYTLGALSAAAVVARARAVDGQHNWSDVVAGGLVGLTTGVLMQHRVQEVVEDYGLRPKPCQGGSCSRWNFRAMLAPFSARVEEKDVVGLTLDAKF